MATPALSELHRARWRQVRCHRIIGTMAALCAVACATDPTLPNANAEAVAIATAASSSGASLRDVNGETVLYATEIDGTRYAYAWARGELTTNAVWELQRCLSDSRIARGYIGPPKWTDLRLVQSEATRCISASGAPQPHQRTVAADRVFDVWLGVSTTGWRAGDGVPLWSQGGADLGAMRAIKKLSSIGPAVVPSEILQCRNVATRDGVVDKFHTEAAPGPFGSYSMQYRGASIERMVKRFDACLRSSGYEVTLP